MYNVLITDDEQIVIDSLTFIIDRSFPGQTKIFPAHSGTDAIKIARSAQIDIVFMDINMPGLNGLESVSKIKQINPAAVIIILSAFDRFLYAQEAINLGAYKYLTKPVNRNLITQTIRNAMTIVDTERNKVDDDIEIHEKLNFVSSIVESDFIYSAVLSGDNNSDLTSYLDYFKIQEQNWFFCCIELPQILPKKRYDAYMQVRDILTSFSRCIIGSCILNRVIVFFPFQTCGNDDGDVTHIRSLMNDIQLQLSLRIASGIRVGVGMPDSCITQTAAAYTSALDALNRVPISGGIAFYFDKNLSLHHSSTLNLAADIQAVVSRVLACDLSGMTAMLQTFFSKLYKHMADDSNAIKNVFFELLVTAQNAVRDICKDYRNVDIDSAFSFFVKTSDRQELELFVSRRLSECTSALIEVVPRKKHPIIVRAQEYIVEHVCGDITLEQTAQYIQVTPVYLSKLFKEHTGDNFIDYVTQLRLEKAKELLQDERLSIKEISRDTGYNDQNYFSKLFRKKFGFTPTEFRNTIYTRKVRHED